MADRPDIDVERAAGRVLMVGVPHPALDAETAGRLAALGAGGVILFARNLTAGPLAASRLVLEIRSALAAPCLLAIDQEGGRVSRLERWTGPTPSAAALAAAGIEACLGFGRATGRALDALGIDLDFAPVVDLGAPDADNGIGDRAFGVDPETVAACAGAFLDGLQGAGVAGCLKHFPGLGPTSVDSHRSLPTANRSAQALESMDLVPFRRLAGRAAAVMVGHACYPALEREPGVPATLSPTIVGGLLRAAIGFRGLVASDDLEMGAVAPLDAEGAAAGRALAAGCDLLLYCSDLERAFRARRRLIECARRDSSFRSRLIDAAGKVELLAGRRSGAGASPALLPDAIADLGRAGAGRPGPV